MTVLHSILQAKMHARLRDQKEMGLYRMPQKVDCRSGRYLYIGDKRFLNFASNDYLGLGGSPKIAAFVGRCFEKYGASASSSRLVGGNFSAHRDAEQACAEYFGYEEALFFPSGFQANFGLLSTLFGAGDMVFFDKHVHASTVSGLFSGKAVPEGFRHNRLSHLEKKLKEKKASASTVVTEGLFSMDGDSPDFLALKKLKADYGLSLIVDEAHSYGVLGSKGRGISLGVSDIGVGTFGKAFGLFGAVVMGPKILREYLVNFAAPYIYTTALPEAHGVAIQGILKEIEDADEKRERLFTHARYMRERLLNSGLKVWGTSYILGIEIGDESQTVALAHRLKEHGFFVFPARYPTVPLGKSIIRVSLTADHETADVDAFCSEIVKQKA